MAGMDLAYWISPSGKVMEPTMYHIGAIIDDPEKFGEMNYDIIMTFNKHGEPLSRNSEGKARNEIMKRVMERGFIRVRKQNIRRSQKWVIELYKLTKRKVKYLANWAKNLIDKKLTDDVFADVQITDLNTFRSVGKSLALLSNGLVENKGYTVKMVEGRTIINSSLDALAQPTEIIEMTFSGHTRDWETHSNITDRIDSFLKE